MPQDGSNNYYYPPGTRGIPDQTIESVKYNTFLDDLTINDLNIARPIHRGGTAATTADGALTNLGAEKANQFVANYDSHVFRAGSFYSPANTPGAPTTQGYVGTAIVATPDAITLEAIDYITGAKFMRQKFTTWGPWVAQVGSAASVTTDFVNVAGDTMTGALNVNVKQSRFGGASGGNFNGALVREDANILLYNQDASNWAGIGTDPSGVFWIRTGIAGSPSAALAIDSNQNVIINNNLLIGGGGQSPTHGAIPSGYLNPNSAAVQWTLETNTGLEGGTLVSGSHTYFGSWSNHGIIFRTNNTDRMTIDSAGTISMTGNVNAVNLVASAWVIGSAGVWVKPPPTYFGLDSDATINFLRWDSTSQIRYDNTVGNLTYYRTNTQHTLFRADFALVVSGSAWKPGGGVWSDASDARIKNVEGDYTRGLAEISQLHPVFYTYKGNDTGEPPGFQRIGIKEQDDKNAKEVVTVPYPNSPHKIAATEGTRYAGLVAQEVEAVMPEMVTQRAAYIDGVAVTDLREMDTTPLIFALINCIKELKTRVEALEATG